MTIRMDEADVIAAAIASGIVAFAAIVLIGWLIYLIVRPSRRDRKRRQSGFSPAEVQEMIALVERMEQRLEMLERIVAQDAGPTERILQAGETAEPRRLK